MAATGWVPILLSRYISRAASRGGSPFLLHPNFSCDLIHHATYHALLFVFLQRDCLSRSLPNPRNKSYEDIRLIKPNSLHVYLPSIL